MSASTTMSPTDLQPQILLLQEIQTVTSSMRRNQRWASGSTSSSYSTSTAPIPTSLNRHRRHRSGALSSVGRKAKDNEGDLMGGFVHLRRSLEGVKDITTITPLDILSPFLALIQSPLTSGPITSLALTSLYSLIQNILPLYLPEIETSPTLASQPSTPLQIALAHVTSALSQCRFPSSSPQQDELVLLRLLRVIESLVNPTPTPTPSGTGKWPTSMLDQMGDESVCELLEVGLGMGARGRLGEGLRNTAQSCVQTIVRACFGRLRILKPEDVERQLKAVNNSGSGGNEKAAAAIGTVESKAVVVESGVKQEKNKEAGGPASTSTTSSSSPIMTGSNGQVEQKAADLGSPNLNDDEEFEDITHPPPFTPYGLPTILELLRVLVALLNPSDQAHTDSMRLSALAILNTALEVGGAQLGKWPELREGVRDEGCRYLFQLIRSDSPALLALSLRTTSTLLSTLGPHLKLQLELFLSYLIDRLTPPTPLPVPAHLLHLHNTASPISRPGTPTPSAGGHGGGGGGGTANADGGITDAIGDAPMPPALPPTPRPINLLLPPVPGETRELMLETLTQIGSRPSFMVDCWVNYDCGTENEDMFERLIGFLTRGVYPIGPPKNDGSTNLFDGLDNVQALSLEILLSFVSAMADRLEEGDEAWPETAPSPRTLTSQKDLKALLLTGAALFNQKPKLGLAFLEKNGIITSSSASAQGEAGTDEEKRLKALATFLRGSTRLDKKLLGEYISRPDQIGLLKAFIGLFDFRGRTIADAMRELLETFRLPGEAQPISRITETFAEHFFSFHPPEIASQDAVYVLAYSVIMLNTDLHNPQNRKRMTIEDYKRNLRGVNDGKDFDGDYLASIHESLKKKEIILPEEHVGQPGFDYAWKSLMQRSRTAGEMIICNTSQFDEPMFRLAWRPLISAIAYAFTISEQDEHIIQRSITGFRQCATLAGHFKLPEVFDSIVLSLSTATGLLEDPEDLSPSANYPVVEKDSQSVTISPLSIRFGTSYRSQLATVVLFTIANGNGNAVREGWLQIFEMFTTLFLHSLLPSPLLQMEDFLAVAGTTTIPMKSVSPNPVTERRQEGGGLLSTLSSYLLSPYGSSTDALGVEIQSSEEDVENTLVAVDCLSSCKLEELYAEILTLELDPLLSALRAIRTLAESRTTGKLQARAAEARAVGEGSPTLGTREGQLHYDPACVFHLETMVSLACRNKAHISETWPIIFEYISTLLSSAQSYSVLLIERAVVGLLRLSLIVSENPELRDQVYIALDVLRSLPSTVLNAVSEQLMAGVARILETDRGLVKSQTEWGLIIALFRATVSHPEASKVTLELVKKMASNGNGQMGLGLSGDNYPGVVALLDEFATAAGAAAAGRQQQSRRGSSGGNTNASLGPSVERGLAALDSLYELRNIIPQLMESSGKDTQTAWNLFWLPPLLVIGKQCVNGCREIRQRAITYLQRLLLSPQLLSGDESTLPTIFDKVLFPVMEELLKPQSNERDPQGMGETRLKAATLLCKIFLQYVVRLVEDKRTVEDLFVKVLDKLERFMRGERDLLNEAGESLKNVVLVMHSSNLLIPPPKSSLDPERVVVDARTPEQQNLWKASAERIERVLPGFLDETIPASEGEVMA